MNPSAKVFLSGFTFSMNSRLPDIVQLILVVGRSETGHVLHRDALQSLSCSRILFQLCYPYFGASHDGELAFVWLPSACSAAICSNNS